MKAFLNCLSIGVLLVWSLNAHAVSHIAISAEHIESPQFEAQHTELHVNLNQTNPQLKLTSLFKQHPDKPASKKDWLQLNITCETPQTTPLNNVRCAEGLLKSDRVHLPFNLQVNKIFTNNQFDIDAVLALTNASFNDEAGLHAAEKLNATLALALKPIDTGWQWNATLNWQSGEIYWQPFYMANGGHQLSARGMLAQDLLTVHNAHLNLKNVGELNANGQLQLTDFKVVNLNADLPDLNLNTAYPLLFKPFLEKTALNNAEIVGRASLKLAVKNTELKSFELGLKAVDIVDKNHQFAFYQLNAAIPWSYDAVHNVSLSYTRGDLLNLPLGKTSIQAEVNRYALTAPKIRLPILDGALNLTDISAARIDQQWYWHLSATLEPISMEGFSQQLKLPRMMGKASAKIPLVTYSHGNLTTDGSVELNVFSGTATVTQLTMQTPLGVTPKLNADIALRNLDLGDLTRTFSFGAIEGKLDGDIENLELQNWKPVRFDAVIQSSAGKYPKKISQRAVENISALGGGGAAAAVQRSFLRFFEQFNYGKMGLSCKLRNDICEMGGVESTPQGYIIVKGSGIPAITVMGYNKTVGWGELLARIKRVTDGNSKAIIK